MSDIIKPNNIGSTNMIVDKTFFEYMHFVSTASLDNIQNCMKRNLRNIRSSNINNHDKILYCYNTYNYWGSIDPEKEVYELFENRANALKDHYEDLIWLYNRLDDYRSKRTLFGIVENWLTLSMVSLSRIIENTFRQYFDLDIMKCDENEVLVDLGAFTGDTVNDYLSSYTGYKKIYCYEIVPATFETLKQNLANFKNIEFRQKGAADKEGTMFISDTEPDSSMHKLSDLGSIEIPVVSLDEDINEPVTFIKMDIEGGEQQAILGCKNHIRSTHPKLAISVYHNNVDIWKCARMIDEIDPTYKFYLRYNGGNYYPSECNLLCV